MRVLGPAIFVFTTLLLTSASCRAASPASEAFLANIRLGSVYLAEASVLAADRSDNASLQNFAHQEVAAERATIVELDTWQAPIVAGNGGPLPMTVASTELQTGRSVAEDVSVEPDRFASPVGTGATMPAAAIGLDHLSAAKGGAFDSLYKATQIDVLRQLSGFYNAYSLTGDDAALRAMAARHLSEIKDQIAEIARL